MTPRPRPACILRDLGSLLAGGMAYQSGAQAPQDKGECGEASLLPGLPPEPPPSFAGHPPSQHPGPSPGGAEGASATLHSDPQVVCYVWSLPQLRFRSLGSVLPGAHSASIPSSLTTLPPESAPWEQGGKCVGTRTHSCTHMCPDLPGCPQVLSALSWGFRLCSCTRPSAVAPLLLTLRGARLPQCLHACSPV